VRIFYVCADPGIPVDGTKGASVHLRSLTAALARAGHDLTVFAARPANGGAAPLVTVRPYESGSSLMGAASTVGRPDLVYERYALGHGGGLLAARDLGVPFALEVNAPLVDEAGQHRPQTVQDHHAEVERMLFRHADAVFAVSEPLRRYVARIRGTDRGTETLPNGCDPALFPAPAPLDARRGHVLVFLGHPKPWHGAEAIPALLADLVARGRDPVLLLIGGGPGADRVAEAAGDLRLADRVVITGPVTTETAARLLLLGEVALAPYPEHPFFYFCPIKVIEYMAAGVPVVSTAQGDVPAILGDTGLVVPAGDRSAMADAVDRLLADDALRRTLGGRARRRALSRFTWDRTARAIVERFLPALIAGGGKAS
jgi:glycosyltransferase involved in cell wall biosynthesis